jgi:geranylgeranyl pyrophosphate synthase/intein/homing endonuclease
MKMAASSSPVEVENHLDYYKYIEDVVRHITALKEGMITANDMGDFREIFEYHKLMKGKAIRPALCMLVNDALNGNRQEAAYFGLGVELVHSGCLAGESKVSTVHGPKAIAEIDCGDVVFSISDGKLIENKVEAKVMTGIKQVYSLKTAHRRIVATANHPFLVYRRIEKPLHKINKKAKKRGKAYNHCLVWVPLEQLRVGDKIIVSAELNSRGEIYKLPKMQSYDSNSSIYARPIIPEFADEKFCQLIGYYIGDGCIRYYKGLPQGVLFSMSDEKMHYVPLFNEVFKTALHFNKTNGHQYACYSRTAAELMIAIGAGGKFDTKRVPAWVFNSPRAHQLAFLRGVLDSDGSVNKQGTVRFAQANRPLVEDLKYLLDSLGFVTTNIYEMVIDNSHFDKMGKPHTKKFGKLWCFSTSDPRKVLREIGTDKPAFKNKLAVKRVLSQRLTAGLHIYNNSKPQIAAHMIDMKNFGYDRVISITPENHAIPVYDIQVNSAHNFIAEGMVVHNSLIHDDAIDNDEVRRGVLSIHERFDISKAILSGDLMASFGFDAIFNIFSFAHAVRGGKEYVRAINRLAKGALVEHTTTTIEPLMDENIYFTMLGHKTSSLYCIAARLGAIAADADDLTEQHAANFGEACGLAFQLTDDIVDVIRSMKAKRPIGDVKEGKVSLPIIHVYKTRPDMRPVIERYIKLRGMKVNEQTDISGVFSHEDFMSLMQAILDSQAFEYAEEKIRYFIISTKEHCLEFPRNEYTAALYNFAEFACKALRKEIDQ